MRKLIFALVLLLPGCVTAQQASEKSGIAPTPQSSAAPTVQPSALYVSPDQLDLTLLLPPPPAPNSEAQKRDIKAVLDAQKARTPALAKQVEADAKSTIYRFADVMGPDFTADKLPVTTAFFLKVQKNLSAFADVSKECYARPRPFVADAKVHPPGDLAQSTKNDPKREEAARAALPADSANRCAKVDALPDYSYSYPSGHSTFGTMTAILLSNMVPEKRAELYKRGWYFGQERVIAGVHFPTDVEAGRIQATVVVAKLMESASFRSDLAAARTELRGVLGLPPL